MRDCNCGGTPKLEGGNGLGAYYYLCDPCELQSVSCLDKKIAEQAWDVLVEFERNKKKNEPA